MTYLNLIDLNKLDSGVKYDNENKVEQEEFSLICDNRQEEESYEPYCVLLKKKIVYSLGISPSFENELWCGVKYGKLIKFDLERQEIVSQNNKAHNTDS